MPMRYRRAEPPLRTHTDAWDNARMDTNTIDLRAIRTAAGMSQQAIAEGLGMSARSGRQTVSQIEARSDWLVSSVGAYIRAAGGTAELVVKVNGEEFRFPLT